MPVLHRTNEPDLYYDIDDYTDPWKNAPHILLQHGYGRSSKFWYRWVPYLARFYKVVRPDLRGLSQPDAKQRLGTQGFDVIGSTPQALGEYMKADIARSAKVIRDTNMRVD